MAIEYTDVARVAGKLGALRTEEECRSSVSRYYYAAYLLLRELHGKRNPENGHPERLDHQDVPALAKSAREGLQADFGNLMRLRHMADYELWEGNQESWQGHVGTAKKLYDTIVDILLEDQKRARRKAVREATRNATRRARRP